MKSTPNILFIFSDQQHWQAAGFMDRSFKTPNLDRLAEEGLVFSNAYCTTPQCSPSRSSIMTGLYPSKTGVLGNVGAAGGAHLCMPTIGSLLQKTGYRTGYFGKWHLGKDPVGTSGWDEDEGVTGKENHKDTDTTRNGLSFIQRAAESDQPFALFLSYRNPHDIYEFDTEKNPMPSTPRDLPETWHKKDLSTVPGVQQEFMDTDQGKVIVGAETPAWQRYQEIYREKTRLYDAEVGQILTALEDTGKLSDTAIIITSDHGDMDTHHKLIYKGPFMYDQMMRVPLIIRPARKNITDFTPRTIDWPTVNVDLVPTIANMTGADLEETDGTSLVPQLSKEDTLPERDFVIGQYYSKQKWINPIRMIRTREYQYNLYQFHGDELYDLTKDPGHITNVAQDPSYADVRSALASQLNEWIKENNDPFFSQHPTDRQGKPIT